MTAANLTNDAQQIEAQMQENEKDSGEEVDTQELNSAQLRCPNSSDGIDACLKVFFVILCVLRFISIINFSIFDTKCTVLEKASVLNCSQEFFTSNPKHCIATWLFTSVVSSSVLLLIIYLNRENLNFETAKFQQILERGSFWSLFSGLIASSVYYCYRITITSNTISILILALLLIWPFVNVGAMCCWNYLPPVQNNATNCIIYWLALTMHLLETAFKLLAVMLDVAYDVIPTNENMLGKKYGKLRGVMVIVMGLNLGLHTELVSFFWKKIFYGEKDLLAGPSINLVEQQTEEEPPT